jgi:hypothetical protein
MIKIRFPIKISQNHRFAIKTSGVQKNKPSIIFALSDLTHPSKLDNMDIIDDSESKNLGNQYQGSNGGSRFLKLSLLNLTSKPYSKKHNLLLYVLSFFHN